MNNRLRKLSHWLMCLYIGMAPGILSCANQKSDAAQKPAAQQPFTKASAVLHGTEGNNVRGVVMFIRNENGVKVVAHLEGLAPGEHGFHIHEFGDCSAQDGASAGGHFNPEGKKHGSPDTKERHIGDLGNIIADEGGSARYERLDSLLSLNGPDSIIGRGVVVHADADDFTSQPSGAAGARVACGTIGVAKGISTGRRLSHHFSPW